MADIVFVGQFIASKVGKTGLTVTVDVDRYTISDGSRTALVTAGSATEGRRGLYHYLLASADLSLYQYVATFITADSSVDQQEIAAIGLVVPDALVSSRLAPATAGRTLEVAATGEASANVTLWKGAVAPDLPSDPADQSAVEAAIDAAVTALQGGDGDTLETLSGQIDDVTALLDDITGSVVGSGDYMHIYTVYNSVTMEPVSGVRVWVTTDIDGLDVIRSAETNTTGQVRFYFEQPGTYYFWKSHDSASDDNTPDTEIVG